jgi:hypothetical protein
MMPNQSLEPTSSARLIRELSTRTEMAIYPRAAELQDVRRVKRSKVRAAFALGAP